MDKNIPQQAIKALHMSYYKPQSTLLFHKYEFIIIKNV